jgi:phosphoribosyl 1,2-cyclic phosphate phosphodiesterase
MRLRFLGTGTSSGVPVIACTCPVCTSTDPRDHRTRTSATLEFTDPDGHPRVILIDASPDLRQQAIRENLSRVDAILITHNHVDHVWGLDEVRRFNDLMKKPIEVFADDHTHGALRRVYQHIFEPHTNVQRSFIADLVPRTIEPDHPFELYGLTITPFTLLHGRLPILGFRFDAPHLDPDRSLLPLAYCTDVVIIPEESRPYLDTLETLVLDALRERPHTTHFTVGQALVEAQQINATRTRFVHMTHDIGHAQTNRTLPSSIQLAYDGLTLP